MVFDEGVLPPGYKFMPIDKQIIKDYLVRKVENTLPDVSWFILEKNIYNYTNPFLLFQEIQRNQGYFFTPITKVNSSGGKNVKRKTGEGTWNGQKPTALLDADNKPIGTKRTYNFDWNVPREKVSQVEREKGHWIMHEYSLLPNYYTNNNIKLGRPACCYMRICPCKMDSSAICSVRIATTNLQHVAFERRGTEFENGRCRFCNNNEDESTNHLLISCKVATDLWQHFLGLLDSTWSTPNRVIQVLTDWKLKFSLKPSIFINYHSRFGLLFGPKGTTGCLGVNQSLMRNCSLTLKQLYTPRLLCIKS